MGHANAVLAVLFVTGFAIFAYGVADEGAATGPRVDVEGVDAAEVPAGSEVVDYRDLPEPVQEAFDRALASDSMAPVAAAGAAVDARYVRYDGRYYEVVVQSAGGGDSPVEPSLGLVGLVLSALSTVVYLLIRRERQG